MNWFSLAIYSLRSVLQQGLALVVCIGFASFVHAAEGQSSSEIRDGYIELDETVISGNQELPKVLYILPWQQPNGLPDIELKADFTEADVFRRLYPPAYRRELQYFETLESIKSTESEE